MDVALCSTCFHARTPLAVAAAMPHRLSPLRENLAGWPSTKECVYESKIRVFQHRQHTTRRLRDAAREDIDTGCAGVSLVVVKGRAKQKMNTKVK
jgi:hypothetical protein